MNLPCPHCDSLNFEEELVGQPPHFRLCCRNGKCSNLHPDPDGDLSGNDRLALKCPECPEPLAHLLRSNAADGKHFRGNIRNYTGGLVFVSFGLGALNVLGDKGPPIAKCHGTVYHVAGRLFLNDPANAQYAQL